MTRGQRLLAILATVAIALSLLFAATAGALTEVTATGWWTDRAGAQELTEGAIEVAASSDGTSVAAMLIANDAPVESATLALTETGTPPAPTAGIELCPLPDGNPVAIGAADGAPLTEAPAVSCADGRVLARQLDRTWTVEIGDLLDGRSSIAVALIPVPSQLSDSPVGGFDPGWVAQFDAFSVTVTSPEDPGSTTTPSNTSTTTRPSAAGPTSAPPTTMTPTSTPRPTAIVPQPVQPAPLTPTTPPPPPVEPLDSPVDESTAESLTSPSLAVGPIADGDDSDLPAKLLKSLLLLPAGAFVGGASVYTRRLLDRRG